MKEVWVNADPWKKDLVTGALEAGADAVIVPSDKVEEVKQLGLIKTVSENGDIRWERDVVRIEIKSAEDEEKIVQLSREKKVVVRTTDWKVIPLENLVARTRNIFVETQNLEEAKTAAGILEKGVDGIIVTERDPARLKEIIHAVKSDSRTLELATLEIATIVPVGMGDRVCVDSCTMMKEGEGYLVGNSSQGLFLVHSESIENPYVAPRPFRVNAGAVHAYIMVPGGKTRYLSELKSGDEILGVNWKGETEPMLVGRVKIERRPLLLMEARGPKGLISTMVQNAETIRLVDPGGKPISVVNLKAGDQVLCYLEEAGRHFGHRVQETITER